MFVMPPFSKINGSLDRAMRVITWQSKTVTLAAITLAVMSLGAKGLGLVRDRLLAATFGAGDTLDIYYVGFRIPDLLFNLLALGAVSAGFLPVFTELYEKNKDEVWRMVGNFVSVLFFGLIFAAAVLWLLAPLLVPSIAPGFAPEKIARAVMVTRLLLFSPILLGVSSVLSSVVQHGGRFFSYAIAPMVYNVGIIAGIVFFTDRFSEKGIAFGVLAGARLHVAVQIPAVLRSGFRFVPHAWPLYDSVKEIIRLSLPRTANLVVNQLILTAMAAIASTVAAGSVAIFMLAENLKALPADMICVSFAIAAFPAFTRAAIVSRENLSELLLRTLQRVLFLVMPASVLIYVLRAQMVRVLYGAGAFSWEDTRLTAAAAAAFAIGIVGFSVLPILIRGFFALKDTVTPFLVAFLSAVIAVAGALGGVELLRGQNLIAAGIKGFFKVGDLGGAEIIAVPLALSFATAIQAALLVIALGAAAAFPVRRIALSFTRFLVAAAIAGGGAWLALRFFGSSVQTDTFFKVLAHGTLGGFAGVVIYLGIAFLLRFPELSTLLHGLRRR